jgi:CheY-like chemotaxis protein
MTTTVNPAVRTLSVLVVDDNHDGADSTATLINLYGFEARAVYSTAEALTELAACPADVVVSDLKMSGEDGFSLAARLTSEGRRPLLVAMTGLPGLDRKCRAAGFTHVFLKPTDPQELIRLLCDHASALAL